MYAESEVEDGVDFTPREPSSIGFMKLCKKCRYWEYGCPLTYRCKTVKRWENADMDDDNTY